MALGANRLIEIANVARLGILAPRRRRLQTNLNFSRFEKLFAR